MKVNKIDVKLDPVGIRVLLKSDQVQDYLLDRGDDLLGRMGDPQEWDKKVHMRPSRATVVVYTDDNEEKWREVASGEVARATKEEFGTVSLSRNRKKPRKPRAARQSKDQIAKDNKSKAKARARKQKDRMKKRKADEKAKQKARNAKAKARNAKQKARARADRVKARQKARSNK